jgi:hypothetical protein
MIELAATMDGVIALGRGDPDLATPAHIVAAAKEALDRGVTHYTHPAGDPALRRAIAAHVKASTGVEYDPVTEVIVTTGACWTRRPGRVQWSLPPATGTHRVAAGSCRPGAARSSRWPGGVLESGTGLVTSRR